MIGLTLIHACDGTQAFIWAFLTVTKLFNSLVLHTKHGVSFQYMIFIVRLWIDMQNPANKREIFCDEKLKTIFAGKEKVGFGEIARLLSLHFSKSS